MSSRAKRQISVMANPSPTEENPALIVGGGIAGCLLAWKLRQRDFAVTLVDDGRPGRASAAAAGLLNPLTGKRLAPLERGQTLIPCALNAYEGLGRLLGQPVLHPMTIQRDLISEEERALAALRCAKTPLGEPLRLELIETEGSFGRLRIHGGGWVDFSALDQLPSLCGVERIHETFDFDNWTPSSPLRWQDRAWRAVVFCQGYAPEGPAAGWPWNAAAGDILTVRLPGWDDTQIRQRGIFTIPLGGDLFRVGSTYRRENLSPQPMEHGVLELLETLQTWTGIQGEVIEKSAGIRPVLLNRRPLIGPLPDWPGCFVLNGLGSKGGWWAPWAAEHLAAVIAGESDPDPELTPPRAVSNRRPRLTSQAQAGVEPFCFEGAVVVDGTAGRGHDTAFLAAKVGSHGHVAAFDRQLEALHSTRQRLEDQSLLVRVRLHHGGHEKFCDFLPTDWRGRISVVMLNLGYLPGREMGLTTECESTLEFLNDIPTWMAPQAAISVLAYRGHPGGSEEHAAVAEWARQKQREGWELRIETSHSTDGPELFLLTRPPAPSQSPP